MISRDTTCPPIHNVWSTIIAGRKERRRNPKRSTKEATTGNLTAPLVIPRKLAPDEGGRELRVTVATILRKKESGRGDRERRDGFPAVTLRKNTTTGDREGPGNQRATQRMKRGNVGEREAIENVIDMTPAPATSSHTH